MQRSKVTDCFKYNFAIVSRIPNSFAASSSFELKHGRVINIEQARKEHEDLVEGLRRVGLDVIELPADEKNPDCLFVDDVAVIINGTALICNPPTLKGKPSRQGELTVVRQVLKKELGLKIMEVDTEKALIEGGDVLWTGREIFVGLSFRSNMLGAQAVAKAFPEYPTTIVKVSSLVTHLKDCITMAGPEIMVVAKSEGAQQTFMELKNSGATGYRYITVDEDEAANVIYANRNLVHLGHEQIPRASGVFMNKLDYPRVAITMVEPLKRGGRLASCVLLVNKVKLPKKIATSAP